VGCRAVRLNDPGLGRSLAISNLQRFSAQNEGCQVQIATSREREAASLGRNRAVALRGGSGSDGRVEHPVARPFLIVGHRGAAGHEPENTLRSFHRALELGVDGIELDVRLSADGELMVFHDATLRRRAQDRGTLARRTRRELRALDAGDGECIPTLREVFEAVDRRVFINIELKARGTAERVEALIGEFIARHGWTGEHFIVSSFLRGELARLRDPRVRRGVLFTRPGLRWAAVARHLRAWSVHPAVRWTNARFVAAAHRHGWRVLPYTANKAKALARMRTLGVDGVFTDYPERARAALNGAEPE
jgi:glycerophosphoryl diester phosphodiesterase